MMAWQIAAVPFWCLAMSFMVGAIARSMMVLFDIDNSNGRDTDLDGSVIVSRFVAAGLFAYIASRMIA